MKNLTQGVDSADKHHNTTFPVYTVAENIIWLGVKCFKCRLIVKCCDSSRDTKNRQNAIPY
jgi:hypothetical protein